MNQYLVSHKILDHVINNISGVLNEEFFIKGGSFMKVTRFNREVHKTAHLYWTDDKGNKTFSRVTTSAQWMATGTGLDDQVVYDYCLKVFIGKNKHSYLNTVDNFILSFVDKKDKDLTYVHVMDSKKLYDIIDTYTKAGDEALLMKGFTVLSGILYLPISQLNEWSVMKGSYILDSSEGTYENLFDGKIKKVSLASKETQRSMKRYGLAFTNNRTVRITMICKETEESFNFDSVTDAYKELIDSDSTNISNLNKVVTSDKSKIKGKNGHWWTAFRTETLENLQEQYPNSEDFKKKFKELLDERFKKITRNRKKKEQV